MKTFVRILLIFCLPAIIWHAPLHCEVSSMPSSESSAMKQEVLAEDFSVWSLLDYNNLSYDRIMNFIQEIEYGDTVSQFSSASQLFQIQRFVAYLAQQGLPEWDTQGREELERDIEQLFSEEDSDSGDWQWALSLDSFGVPTSIAPAVWCGNNSPDIKRCFWGIGKGWHKTKKFVKKHKKPIIIAAVVTVVVVAIVVTKGAAAPLAAPATKSLKDRDPKDDEAPHINKPGEVRFQDEGSFPDDQDARDALGQKQLTTSSQTSPHEHMPSSLLPIEKMIETVKENADSQDVMDAVQAHSEFVKETLDPYVPSESLNVPEGEEQSFWESSIEAARRVGSKVTHKLVDFGLETAAAVGPLGWALDDRPDRQPFNEFLEGDVIPYCDGLHEAIDGWFNTDYSKQYGVGARTPSQEPQTMTDLLKDFGKDVAFCFVPIPGSQFNKASKIAKTAKLIVETAKAAGVVRTTAGIATVGGALTTPPAVPDPTLPITQDVKPVPREQGNITVYRSFNENTGEVQYVGITNSTPRRTAEHRRNKGIEIVEIEGLTNLTKEDSKGVEQALIEIHNLEKNGGSLKNRINSISQQNPQYYESVMRGMEILKEIKYDGLEEVLE